MSGEAARAKVKCGCTGGCGGPGYQWELPWLHGLVSGVHIAVEVGDGVRLEVCRSTAGGASPEHCMVMGVSCGGLGWHLAILQH